MNGLYVLLAKYEAHNTNRNTIAEHLKILNEFAISGDLGKVIFFHHGKQKTMAMVITM